MSKPSGRRPGSETALMGALADSGRLPRTLTFEAARRDCFDGLGHDGCHCPKQAYPLATRRLG